MRKGRGEVNVEGKGGLRVEILMRARVTVGAGIATGRVESVCTATQACRIGGREREVMDGRVCSGKKLRTK